MASPRPSLTGGKHERAFLLAPISQRHVGQRGGAGGRPYTNKQTNKPEGTTAPGSRTGGTPRFLLDVRPRPHSPHRGETAGYPAPARAVSCGKTKTCKRFKAIIRPGRSEASPISSGTSTTAATVTALPPGACPTHREWGGSLSDFFLISFLPITLCSDFPANFK